MAKYTLTPEYWESGVLKRLGVSRSDGSDAGEVQFFADPDAGGVVEFLPKVDMGEIPGVMECVCQWAAAKPGWVVLRCALPADDKALSRALQKAGFVSSIDARGNLTWDRKLSENNFIITLGCIGLALGVLAGGLLHNVGIGAIVGVVLGLAVGSAMYFSGKKKTKKD